MNASTSTVSSSSSQSTSLPMSAISQTRFLQRAVRQLFARLIYQECAVSEDFNHVVQKIHRLTSQQFASVDADNMWAYMGAWEKNLNEDKISLRVNITDFKDALQKYAISLKEHAVDERICDLCIGCLDSHETSKLFPRQWQGDGLVRISASTPGRSTFGSLVVTIYDKAQGQPGESNWIPWTSKLENLQRKCGENFLSPSGFHEQRVFWQKASRVFEKYKDYILTPIQLKSLSHVLETKNTEEIQKLWSEVEGHILPDQTQLGCQESYDLKFSHQPDQKASTLKLVNQSFHPLLSGKISFEHFLKEVMVGSNSKVFLTFNKEKQNLPKILGLKEGVYTITRRSTQSIYSSDKMAIEYHMYDVTQQPEGTAVIFHHLSYEGDDESQSTVFEQWQQKLYAVAHHLMNDARNEQPLWVYADSCPQVSRFLIGYDMYVEWQKCLMKGYEPERIEELQIFLQAYLFQFEYQWGYRPIETYEQFVTLLRSLTDMGADFKKHYVDEILKSPKDDDMPSLSQVTEEDISTEEDIENEEGDIESEEDIENEEDDDEPSAKKLKINSPDSSPYSSPEL